MSFWFYGRKKDGRRSLYSVNVPLLPLVALLGVIIGVILAIGGSLR